ncbi:MAG: MFS transporter [Acidobacteria bacterium]|nr:MFS transporter [Acidobacteriota bacterium]
MRPFLSKWGLPILLFLATTLNYLDRQTLAILAPRIQNEMGLDNEALGWLFAVFYYSYTFSQFGVGLALDRSNLRWAYGLAVLAWSAACGLTGLARGFWGLVAFRLLLGVTESANWPAAMRIISRLLPAADRPLGNGIFTSGTSVGALIAPGAILGIAAWLGWRWAFAAVGVLGTLWFGLWAACTGSPRLAPVWTASAPEPGGRIYAGILRNSQFWRVFAVTILINPCLYFNLNWLPTYFVQQRGIAAGRDLGWILTSIYLGLDLGYLACGFATLWLARRGHSVASARRIVFLAASLLQALSVVVPLIPELRGAIAALVVVNFALGVWVAVYLTMAQEVSKTHVSTAAGLLGGSGSLAGALAMWAVGRITARTASFALPMAAVGIAAVLQATAGLAVTRDRIEQ